MRVVNKQVHVHTYQKAMIAADSINWIISANIPLWMMVRMLLQYSIRMRALLVQSLQPTDHHMSFEDSHFLKLGLPDCVVCVCKLVKLED